MGAEMKISLSFRIKPLDLEAMDSDELKDKATELFNTILSLETEKYDCEQRRINQDYELKELKERQKVQLRQKAAKRGLDPEAFTGKYPPRIRMFSKYERRTDTRTYADRKGLYEGGWEEWGGGVGGVFDGHGCMCGGIKRTVCAMCVCATFPVGKPVS